MPGVDGGAGQGDRDHGLAGAGRSDEQDVAGVVEEPQRGELPDELLVDPGLGGEVEVLDPYGAGREANRNRPVSRRAWAAATSMPSSRSNAAIWRRSARGRRPGRRSTTRPPPEPQLGQMRAQPLVGLRLRAAHRLAGAARGGAIAVLPGAPVLLRLTGVLPARRRGCRRATGGSARRRRRSR